VCKGAHAPDRGRQGGGQVGVDVTAGADSDVHHGAGGAGLGHRRPAGAGGGDLQVLFGDGGLFGVYGCGPDPADSRGLGSSEAQARPDPPPHGRRTVAVHGGLAHFEAVASSSVTPGPPGRVVKTATGGTLTRRTGAVAMVTVPWMSVVTATDRLHCLLPYGSASGLTAVGERGRERARG
jgi:hypothetical protein